MDYMTLSKFPATVCLYKAGLRCIVFTTAMQVCSSTAFMHKLYINSFTWTVFAMTLTAMSLHCTLKQQALGSLSLQVL